MERVALAPVRKLFPDYVVEVAFKAAQLLYHVQVDTRILVQHELSVFGRYILRSVALGVDRLPDIAHLLGVDERDLAIPGAELLRAGLVAGGIADKTGQRRLVVTERGREQLKVAQHVSQPRRRKFHLHYDPLTKAVLPYEALALKEPAMRKEGIFVIPHRSIPPTPDDLTLAGVAEAVRGDPVQSRLPGDATFDVVSLLGMKEAFPEYLADITVFFLRHVDSAERLIVALRGAQDQPRLSQVLQQLHESGKLQVPAEAKDTVAQHRKSIDFRSLVPAEFLEPVAQLARREEQLGELEEKVASRAAAHAATQNETERKAAAEALAKAQEEVKQLREERDALHVQLQAKSQGTIDVIRTEEHRTLLEEALKTAKDEVIIVSPWMNPGTVNYGLCQLIRQAMQRGVRIRIAYGYEHERTMEDAARQRQLASVVINRLHEARRDLRPDLLEIVDARGTHEKILVCDRAFGVAGSFNWLSYRGEIDTQYRREVSFVVREFGGVEKLAAQALEVFAAGRR